MARLAFEYDVFNNSFKPQIKGIYLTHLSNYLVYFLTADLTQLQTSSIYHFSYILQMKTTAQYFSVVLLIILILYKVVLRFE